MKTTVYLPDFVQAFRRIRPKQFSDNALVALFNHLEAIDREYEHEMDLDVIALCCDWTEYPDAIEAAEAYGWESEDVGDDEKADTSDREALEFLADETTVIEFEGGVLVQNY
jgi:hypothetical protein